MRSHPGQKPRRILRRLAWLPVAVAVVAALSFVVNRMMADKRAVTIRTIGTASSGTHTFDGTLRLAAFNIAHGRGTNDSNWSSAAERRSRLIAIADLLKEEQIDIAVVNEVDFSACWTSHENQAEIIAECAGFPFVVEQRNLDLAVPFARLRFGNAILSRFPVVSARLLNLPSLSSWEWRLAGGKKGMTADIDLGDGTIRVCAVHWEHRDEPTRIASARVVANAARESPFPFICMGDFNSPLTIRNGDESEAHTPTALDTLINSGLFQHRADAEQAPEQFTFASYHPRVTIDWVLIPPSWEFVTYRVQPVQLSDHRPVFAEIRRKE